MLRNVLSRLGALTAGAAVLAGGALNWLIFFLGLQLLSLSLYILVAVRKGEAGGNEAGLKYFIMSAVGSAFLIFGIALLYAVSGTLELAGSLAAAGDEPVLLLAPGPYSGGRRL